MFGLRRISPQYCPAKRRACRPSVTIEAGSEVLAKMECELRQMATDYDAPRKTEDDGASTASLEELQAQRSVTPSATAVDVDETDAAENFELPGADLSGEELLVRVVPAQDDEFTCASCFLVRHRSQVALEKNGMKYCSDCEG